MVVAFGDLCECCDTLLAEEQVAMCIKDTDGATDFELQKWKTAAWLWFYVMIAYMSLI